MNKTRAIAAGTAIIMGLACLAACAPKKTLTDAPLDGEMFADFSAGDPGEKVLFASNGWSNGSVFNARWSDSQVTFSDGQMHLGIADNPVDPKPANEGFLGGEARSTYYYGFGDYEVRMKPSTSVGTASTFFVCTGDYDVYDGVPNPWDEIDIEFLGQDTTKVQFNYYADGQGGHEHMHDLGFDASEGFHNYGFRWAEDYITWFVDGKPVYRVDKADVPAGEKFPATPGRILTNYWCGTEDAEGWMGEFAGPDGNTVDYEWIKTSATKTDPPGGDPYKGVTYDGDWNEVEALTPGFVSTEEYTVTPDAAAKSARITYTDIAGNSYKNVEMDVTSAASDKNFAHLVLKNNGTETVHVRVNLVNDELVSSGKQNVAVNTAASQNGEVATTDTVYGGSFFVLEGGAEAVCEIKFAGIANKLQLMIDSATNEATTSSGDVTVSDIKFAGKGEAVEEEPEIDWDGIEALDFGFASTEEYTVTAGSDNKSAQITYTNIAGGTYQNVEMDVTSAAADKNVMHIKIANNGTETVTVRINLNNDELAGAQNVAVNKSATQDGVKVPTDLAYGGSTFTIAAGATAVCVVEFDGVANKLQLMIDTSTYNDETTHSGDVTVSELKFADKSTQSGGNTPTGDPVALTFSGEGDANCTLTATAGSDNLSATLAYHGSGLTYKPFVAGCASLATGKTVFTVTIKNNRDEAVTVRVDVQGTTSVETGDGSSTNCTNVSATCTGGTGLYTDLVWGGTKITLSAQEEVTLVITFDGNGAQGAVQNILVFAGSADGVDTVRDANITVSNFLFG